MDFQTKISLKILFFTVARDRELEVTDFSFFKVQGHMVEHMHGLQTFQKKYSVSYITLLPKTLPYWAVHTFLSYLHMYVDDLSFI